MDLSGIIVIVVLTALALGGLVWMEINSRKNAREQSGSGSSDANQEVPEVGVGNGP
jgi:hypothetical protein